jgi:phage recombination protein Bet
MIETVWPGISELRTTAFRTGQYACMHAPDFGPTLERTFKGKAGRGKSKGQERSLTLQFPEWCRVTITRELTGKERSFVGPTVYWLEAYGKWADTDVPNEMWSNRPVGQLEKCAEAGALRRAFPEEIGNALTAEEMEGQHAIDGAAHARKSRSRKASRPRVPEGSASLSRRSWRNHRPSPPRHRPSFPNRLPPGKKAIPQSPMTSRPRRNKDDTDAMVSETPHLSLRYKLVG